MLPDACRDRVRGAHPIECKLSQNKEFSQSRSKIEGHPSSQLSYDVKYSSYVPMHLVNAPPSSLFDHLSLYATQSCISGIRDFDLDPERVN